MVSPKASPPPNSYSSAANYPTLQLLHTTLTHHCNFSPPLHIVLHISQYNISHISIHHISLTGACHCIVISNTNTQHNPHRTTERSQRLDDDPICPRWSSSEENWSRPVLQQLHIVHFSCIHSTQFTSSFPFHNHNLSLGKLKNQFCFYRFPFLDYRRIPTHCERPIPVPVITRFR